MIFLKDLLKAKLLLKDVDLDKIRLVSRLKISFLQNIQFLLNGRRNVLQMFNRETFLTKQINLDTKHQILSGPLSTTSKITIRMPKQGTKIKIILPR